MMIDLPSLEQTERFGAVLWQSLPEKCVIYLKGELGAGKTTLVRSVLRAAGFQGTVKSPTYMLVEEYKVTGREIFHFDLYRLKDPEELEWMGIRDYFQRPCLSFIEWPEMGTGFLPSADLEMRLAILNDKRRLEIHAVSEKLKKNIYLNWKNKDILL